MFTLREMGGVLKSLLVAAINAACQHGDGNRRSLTYRRMFNRLSWDLDLSMRMVPLCKDLPVSVPSRSSSSSCSYQCGSSE